MNRPYTVVAIQHGPGKDNKEENMKIYLDLIDKAAKEKSPDLIVLGELFSTKFFPSAQDPTFFERYAEPLSGPTSELLARKAREYGCAIIAGFFEKGRLEGEYYNSAMVLGSDGNIIQGVLPSGRTVECYRKVQIPLISQPVESYEKLYFKPGPGFPIFNLGKVKAGVMICYDVYFCEGPRSMSLQGAELIAAPTSARFPLDERFIAMFRGIAAANQTFLVFANKAGKEERAAPSGREWDFFGRSCIINPVGDLLAEAPVGEPFKYVGTTVDLDKVRTTRLGLQIFRDRRPETYGLVTDQTGLLV
ncbi:MAG: carbon-nitrogen hydrolase family protein [Candidatus Bathyarchaeia archaeon]